MTGVNKVILIGNLGKGPEIKYTPNGQAIAKFSLATTERKNGEDKTEWHWITAFGRLAEVCAEYLEKGRQVYIEGRLQTRTWDGAEGDRRFRTEVIANKMHIFGGLPGGGKKTRTPGACAAAGEWPGSIKGDEISA